MYHPNFLPWYYLDTWVNTMDPAHELCPEKKEEGSDSIEGCWSYHLIDNEYEITNRTNQTSPAIILQC